VATAREDLVLLHGFAGTGRAWEQVVAALGPARYRPLTPDLRGHGAAASRRPITFADCARDALGAARGPFTLAGYSLGGRVALHAALTAPQRIARLVLVATTAGLQDPAERARRRAADEQLAAWAQGAGIDDWVARWTAQPLFAGTPAAAAARWEEDLRRNDPAALADVLRGIGTGSMAPLWDRLGELTMPVDVVTGERDAKFTALGRRLVAGLPRARLTVVPGAGHGLPREAPEALAAVLQQPGP
jgi:2-succinyl-6-hydroxy-2,4-cyclohexadiene-1-carboxylate synthase